MSNISTINTLSSLIDIITTNRKNYYLKINDYVIRYDSHYQLYFITNKFTNSCNNLNSVNSNNNLNYENLINKQELIRHLFKKNVNFLNIFINHYEIVFYLNKYAIIVIQKAWKRYRMKTAKIRNDLVIRGLSELWYHPSRISFEC